MARFYGRAAVTRSTLRDLLNAFAAPRQGARMMNLIRDLYPICRSITGDGNRQTITRLCMELDLQIHEVPSGTPVLDWSVPDEWNIRDAWIKDPQGRKIVDFQKHNLHVLGYSQPVHYTLPLEELEPHLHSLPEHPDWIPYRTSYYNPAWGFCLPDTQRRALPPGNYEVMIDADLAPGHLTYAELVLPGAIPEECLISVHICHPSLANDNLAGIAVAAALASLLGKAKLRHTFRFVFIPGTIGSITWLARNRERVDRIRHGLVLSCMGDSGALTYKKSRQDRAPIDQAVTHVLQHSGAAHHIQDFSPYGYDERQYGSPGFNLPVGLLTRSPHGTYSEYHTSADDLDLVRPEALADSLRRLLEIVEVVEGNATFVNQFPYGEPQLGRRGLYDGLGGASDRNEQQLAMLWVLNQSDGHHSLLDIADRAGMPFHRIAWAAQKLANSHVIKPLEE